MFVSSLDVQKKRYAKAFARTRSSEPWPSNENWIRGLISNLPETDVVIASERFLKNAIST